MMKVRFDHNNSGGSWWFKDADWLALEKAGWTVEWFKDQDQDDRIFKADEDGRWLGALATHATKDFPSLKAAVEEWERITHRDFFEQGCNCCGAPFSMSGGESNAWESVSGDSVEREVMRPW